MKCTLVTGLVAVALIGSSFGQAGNQGTPNPPANQGKGQGQNPQDETNFQKGNRDPTEPTKHSKQDPTRKRKDRSGKKKNKAGVPPPHPR
jgi:hypothetical protein